MFGKISGTAYIFLPAVSYKNKGWTKITHYIRIIKVQIVPPENALKPHFKPENRRFKEKDPLPRKLRGNFRKLRGQIFILDKSSAPRPHRVFVSAYNPFPISVSINFSLGKYLSRIRI